MRVSSITNSNVQSVNKQQNPKAANFSRVSNARISDTVSFKGKEKVFDQVVKLVERASSIAVARSDNSFLHFNLDGQMFSVVKIKSLSPFAFESCAVRGNLEFSKIKGSITTKDFKALTQYVNDIALKKNIEKYGMESKNATEFFNYLAGQIANGKTKYHGGITFSDALSRSSKVPFFNFQHEISIENGTSLVLRKDIKNDCFGIIFKKPAELSKENGSVILQDKEDKKNFELIFKMLDYIKDERYSEAQGLELKKKVANAQKELEAFEIENERNKNARTKNIDAIYKQFLGE